jgi:hypothetical protein
LKDDITAVHKEDETTEDLKDDLTDENKEPSDDTSENVKET